jgi:hypothetical protein
MTKEKKERKEKRAEGFPTHKKHEELIAAVLEGWRVHRPRFVKGTKDPKSFPKAFWKDVAAFLNEKFGVVFTGEHWRTVYNNCLNAQKYARRCDELGIIEGKKKKFKAAQYPTLISTVNDFWEAYRVKHKRRITDRPGGGEIDFWVDHTMALNKQFDNAKLPWMWHKVFCDALRKVLGEEGADTYWHPEKVEKEQLELCLDPVVVEGISDIVPAVETLAMSREQLRNIALDILNQAQRLVDNLQ